MGTNETATLARLTPQEVSVDVLREKYCKGEEVSIDDVQVRVARALAQVEDPSKRAAVEAQFLWALRNGFVPGGRINSAAGTDIKATLINCFVQPVGDAVTESVGGKPSIYGALAKAAETMRRGGGVGYNFSSIRPKGAKVKGTASTASGPISYMRVFDRSCETVESAGSRRGAQMGMLNCDHPDVEDFIGAKRGGDLTNFNISVAVTDAFMQAVVDDRDVDLVHEAEPGDDLQRAGAYRRDDGKWVYRKARARAVWEKIMQSTYDHAEPGVIFIDRVNADNNLNYCETIEATNPCAEQPLPAYGCCCLGSVNLTRFVRDPFTDRARFDEVAFRQVCAIAVRMLDNVLDASYWPLPEQLEESKNKRRVGLGFLGLGDALIMLGLRYDSQEARDKATVITCLMRDSAYEASVDLAKEKGAFPLFDAAQYLDGKGTSFATRLPTHIINRIRKYGIRNSHLLSIAPTGTISLAFADNASNGIEPAFSWFYTRKKRMADGSKREYRVYDHAYRLFKSLHGLDDDVDLIAFDPEVDPEGPAPGPKPGEVFYKDGKRTAMLTPAFVGALEMQAEDHLGMVAAVAPYCDTAISKTVNVPADYPYEDFKDLYLGAWKAKAKGLATYRPNTVLGSVLSVEPAVSVAAEAATATQSAAVAPTVGESVVADDDPLTKVIARRPVGELDGAVEKIEYGTHEGKKAIYIVTSFMPVEGTIGGKRVAVQRPLEFFMPAGQAAESQQWITATMRNLSLAARSGFVAKALADMRKVTWDRGPVRCGVVERADGSMVPRFHDSEVAAIAYAIQQMLKRRGFLDAEGNQVPAKVLARTALASSEGRPPVEAAGESAAETAAASVTASAASSLLRSDQPAGQKCGECGSRNTARIDGCTKCLDCGAIGACG